MFGGGGGGGDRFGGGGGGMGGMGGMMMEMDRMMGSMMARHNQAFQQMDQMMGSTFDDPFFSGRRGGGMGMLGGGAFQMLGDGRGGDRGGGGGDGGRRGGRGGGAGEMDLFGGTVSSMSGGGGGNGAMYVRSSVMSSDGSGNVYRRDQQHKQVGDVSESNFHEQDTRSQREAIGLRRGLGGRSRAVTRTRHGGGDEEVNNVLNGVSEADASAFDNEWQQRAHGGGAGGLQDRRGTQTRLLTPQQERVGQRRQSQRPALTYGGHGGGNRQSASCVGRDIAPQGDMFGHVGSARGGGGGGGGGGRFAPLPARGGGGGGGANRGGSARQSRPAPSHRLMPPQAD